MTHPRTHKSKQMTYRKATQKDLASVFPIFNDYRVWYEKETDLTGAEKFISERLQNNDSEIFIAENSDQQILGFVQLYPLFSSTRMKRLWLLNDLFVAKDHRGKGISIGLIDKAKELAKATNACALMLETDKSNFIGNKLYPRTGFKMNEISNYYEWANQ